MEKEHLLSIFRETGALLEGHFQLTSGLHSGTYFQCAKVLQYPKYTQLLCGELAGAFAPSDIQVVAAPALGGIVVGQEVGRQLDARTIFAERKDGRMQFRRGFEIRQGERVLVCEDVVTTGGSVAEVISIVGEMGGMVAGVGYIVDRSGGKVTFPLSAGGKQVALLAMDVVSFTPDACPFCKEAIPVVKPGSRGNR